MALDYQKTLYRSGPKRRLVKTSYGQMNQWQNFMTNDWSTYEFLNRQAALSPVRRRPPPTSPHHGVSSTRLLSVPAERTRVPVPAPPASESHLTQQSHSPRREQAPEPQRITIPISATLSPDSKKSQLEPLIIDFLQADQQNDNDMYEMLPTGRRTKRRKKLAPLFKSEDPAHMQYYQSGGYDDYHKTFLKLQQHGLSPRFPEMGPPKLRAGNGGGSWRHVKQVLQAGGNRRLFVDGQPRIQDNNRILYEEVPGGNIIQPVAKNTLRKDTKPWTAHQLAAFKAAEGSNYMIMR